MKQMNQSIHCIDEVCGTGGQKSIINSLFCINVSYEHITLAEV